MKSLCEVRTGKPFDWHKQIEACITLGLPSTAEMMSKASKWTTCACGNQCDVIPRDNRDEPLDGQLSHLGMQFMRDIDASDFEGAKNRLEEIEERSAYLIEEIRISRENTVKQLKLEIKIYEAELRYKRKQLKKLVI